MDFTRLLVTVSAACALISIISIIVFFVCLIKYKRMQHFLSSLYSSLFITDIGAAILWSLQQSIKSETTCKFTNSLQQFFIISYFMVTSAMTLFLLVLISRQRLWFLSKLKESIKYQVSYHFIFYFISAILTTIASLVYPSYLDERGVCASSRSSRLFSYVVWLVTTVFNFVILGYMYFSLRKTNKISSGQKYSVRIVLSIAIIVGLFRLPYFIFVLSSRLSTIEIFESGREPLAYFSIFANALTVIQTFVVVVVILINNHVIKCCKKGKSTFDSSEEAKSKSRPSSQATKIPPQDISLSVVASEEDNS